ncbi:peptidase M24, structural domain-containing protein [Radiomyces spectabilis]|uniref:peptidase M24, structural domain-containing protein n=1 Tax=Radiomyces spectabilis TaxID=64574 RepID=UPI00221F742A|nr:peptidase M24, structural domain-containing protein [Radiomyces spectabilis]KAI8374326.1 peptidase M24, structural domain-containing protein [Radiomyces spectabilis]
MSGMELTVNYPPSKFAADNDLSSPNVVEKYTLAADIVNVVLPEVLSKVSPGVSVCDLCQYGDDLIEAYTSRMHKKLERGVATPTCVSVNNLVQYVSPLEDNDYNLKAGDVVKIELGAHVDGYIATAAHTTVVNQNPQEPLRGTAADVVCATYYAFEAAMRMLRPGVKSSDISRVITEIAAYYRCEPVEGSYSSMMKRFVLRAGKDVENRLSSEMTVEELEKMDFQIEANQVYQLNVVLTSGSGKVKFSEYKPFVFQRDVNRSYNLKMKSARLAYTQINEKHTVFPFSIRAISGNHARLGLTSVVQHELVTPFPVMRSALNSDVVAQFKATILVTPEGQLRTTLPQPLPYVHSQYCIPQPTQAANVLSAPALKLIRPFKGFPAVPVEFGQRHVEEEDVAMEMD